MAAHPVSDSILKQTLTAYRAAGGNQVRAAQTLGISRRTLQERLAHAEERKITAEAPDPNDIQVLKGRIKQLETGLRSHENQSEQSAMIKAAVGVLARQVEDLDPPAWTVDHPTKTSSPGVPTLFISDLHWGETVYPSQINNVNEYSIRTAHRRMTTLVTSAVHLLRIISPKLDYPGIVVPLGGDMISGNIHDELTATNELNSMPAVLDLFGVLVGVISGLADTFGRIFLPCVSGNHGRDTQKIWNKDRHATSFDWLLYRFLAKHFEADKRITFFIPDGIAAHYKIYDYRYRLSHGDKLGRGGDGIIGMLGPVIRGDHRTRSRDAQIDLGYDTQIIGHYHQYTHTQRVIVNGCLKGMDEYAYTEGFPYELPQQALWLTQAKHGITFRMPVFVEQKRGPFSTEWVSVPK